MLCRQRMSTWLSLSLSLSRFLHAALRSRFPSAPSCLGVCGKLCFCLANESIRLSICACRYAYFASKDIKLVRLPFKWERMQPNASGPLAPAFVALVHTQLEMAQNNSMKVSALCRNWAACISHRFRLIVSLGDLGVGWIAMGCISFVRCLKRWSLTTSTISCLGLSMTS
jgi:hypothetical protein